jgi:hypothetical protein
VPSGKHLPEIPKLPGFASLPQGESADRCSEYIETRDMRLLEE